VHFTIVGSGAVGGYYGALLARAGHRVTFVARGAHLRAIQERGLRVRGPLGDFTVRAEAAERPAGQDRPDVVMLAVKTYDNDSALPLLPSIVGSNTAVLTLQNGVDSVDQVAAVVGEAAVLGGATYIATAVTEPGLIDQTGTHRRIVFGEVFGDLPRLSERVRAIADVMIPADIHAEPVPDARVPLWEKFIYLAPFASFTGAARLPIGPVYTDPEGRAAFLAAVAETAAVARASGVAIPADLTSRIETYVAGIPPTTRSSLLIDLEQGKRIEVEALQGVALRRAAAHDVPTPIVAALYAVLKPWAGGNPRA
jgi:2-dehydropantoate 2-reductase